MQLLLWPQSLVEVPNDSDDDESTGNEEGFILGWSNESSQTSQCPTSTVVAAGIEWLAWDAKIQNEYQALQSRLKILQGQDKLLCLCPHGHRHRNRASESRQNHDLLRNFRVVAYFSRRSIPSKIQTWLRKERILHLQSNNPQRYPNLVGNNLQQVLLYETDKVYRHNLSGPESSFGNIMTQASSAKSILEHFATIQSSSSSSASNTPSKGTSTKTPPQNETTEIDKGNSTWKTKLEQYSMLACHYRTITARRADTANIPTSKGICRMCQKQLMGTTAVPQEERTNNSIRLVLDYGVGVMFGLYLLSCWSSGGGTLLSFASSYYFGQQPLEDWLDWLERFPIGFKLNVPLTLFLGKETRALLTFRELLLDTISGNVASLFLCPIQHPQILLFIQAIVVLASVALGGSGCVALLMDILRLSTIHLALLSKVFRYVYSMEFYLLGSMWLLFRGKKRNILRNRTDTMEYDSMQLLLGSILFVMTLFLLTTVLVYYTFFSLFDLVARSGASVTLWVLYVCLQDYPFGTIYLRYTHPGMFTAQVLIRERQDTSSTLLSAGSAASSAATALITTIEPVPESFGSILASTPELVPRRRAFKTWFGSRVADILSGNPTSKTLVERLEGTLTT